MISKFASPLWAAKLETQISHNLYKKGQYIYYENNPVFGLHFICKGKVKVVTAGRKGKDQIVRLAGNGHVLGSWPTNPIVTYSNSAVAIEDSLVCFISTETLKEAFLANPELTLYIMGLYSQELINCEKRLEYFSQACLNERVAEALLYTIEVFGICPKHSKIAVKLTRKEIGSIVGATSEQVSRVLSFFASESIIDLAGKDIIVSDKDKLVALARAGQEEAVLN